MNTELPPLIQRYVDASNAHDVKSILDCFAHNAVVQDEGETLHGTKEIELWIVKTIEKYQFHFRPLDLTEEDAETIVSVEVSGTFDGSPVTLDYHFAIQNDKIVSYAVK